jgi:hypothetical protein
LPHQSKKDTPSTSPTKKATTIKFETKNQTQLRSANNHIDLSHVNAKVHNAYATLHILKMGITKKPKHPV